jgi:hypothetical protein
VIRGDRAMRQLRGYKFCREPIAGIAHRQQKSSLTPIHNSFDGDIGRFRMCADLMFRRRALADGFVVIGGKKIAARARRNTEEKRRRQRRRNKLPLLRSLLYTFACLLASLATSEAFTFSS